MPLPDLVVRLARGANLATVVTLMPDGRPQAQYTWIDCDDDHLLVNTVTERQRFRNVQRDDRITVLIPGEHPWVYAEVRGRVVETVGGQIARDHIDSLARKYLGVDYPNPVGPKGRVILKIAPERINQRDGDDQRITR